jgi:hypothetical protein
MSQRFITVLKSLSGPPRADFLFAAVHSGHFETQELLDLFGEDCVDTTLKLALEYIDAGSILVLSSRREPYLRLLEQFAALRAQPGTSSVVLNGKHS